VLAFKFGGASAAAADMATPMYRLLEDWAPPVDAVVPVPLGGMRQRTRGYNQAALLAGAVAKLSGRPLESQAIRRTSNTPPQTQQVDAIARRRNVKEAFGPGKKSLSGSVLLVDDVTTTGATLHACSRVLIDAGAAQVHCLTFARED
jgi:ComF family protein